MRTNIDIDDATLEAAMKAGPFKTKKEAVDAGLRLLARQVAYREVLKWEGKLKWDGDDEAPAKAAPAPVRERAPAVKAAARQLASQTSAHGRR